MSSSLPAVSNISIPRIAFAPRLLKAKDAAVYLAIGIDKLRLLVQQGELPYIPGGNPSAPWLFDLRDLDAWVERAKIRIE